jgi:hypothetical protein
MTEPARTWAEAHRALSIWYRRARESQFAHYTAATRFAVLARFLGVPSVVLSAAAGTTLFATLQKDSAPPALRLAVGLVSVLAGVLAALQTFLGFNARADRHRAAAAAYGAVRREIEQYHAVPPQADEAIDAALTAIRARLDEIAERAPDVPERTWNKARKQASAQTSEGSQLAAPSSRP